MSPRTATAERVDRAAMVEFVRPRHRGSLVTFRRDGSPQMSPVACGLDGEDRVVVSTYPERAKVHNLRREPRASMLIHSNDWDDPYVQLDGTCEVIDLPDSVEPLVDYYRAISGEHPDWDEYREAMRKQGKSLIRLSVERWGPIAAGGFPPDRDPR